MNKSTTTYYNVPLVDTEIDRLQSLLNGMEHNRDYWMDKCKEAREWARKMLHEANIAQQNHVSAIQREMITGGKLFDRETRLTTLAKELGRVQKERDVEVAERELLEDKLDFIRRQVSVCNPPDPYAILIDIWKYLNAG